MVARNGGSWNQYTGYRSGNPNVIYAGETVCRRAGAASTATVATGGRYVVRSGDTLSGIAARLGIGYTQLTGYRSGNPNVIYPGEVLHY